MAKRISQLLPPATRLGHQDLVPIMQNGQTKHAKAELFHPLLDVQMRGVVPGEVDDERLDDLIVEANESNKTLYFPRGTYPITGDALETEITASVYAPDAILQMVPGSGGSLVRLNYSEGFDGAWREFRARQLLGDGQEGTGLYVKRMDYGGIRLGDIRYFDKAIHVDGSTHDNHIGVNTIDVATIMANNIGLLLNSGDTNRQCEQLQVRVGYMQGQRQNNIVIGLGQFTTFVAECVFWIGSMELNYPNANGFNFQNVAKRNRTIVESLGNASGTGKLIITDGEENRWQVPGLDLSLVTKTGNDIFDTETFASDGTGRSRISGTAPPASGKWRNGDICWNHDNASPVPGWRCTADGTPGTWVELLANGMDKIELLGSDSGLDLSNGTKVERKASDGRLQLKAQNNVTEVVGALDVSAMPTADPGVPGRLWRDGTTVKISV